MAATYTKGAVGDTFVFAGNVTVEGTLTPNTVAETYTATAAGTPITIDAGTTDHTGASLIAVNLDVNSANCKVMDMDIDVGTALSSGEKVYGVYVDQLGLAGDDAASEMTGVLVRSATNATGGINTGVQLTGAFDTGVDVASANTTGVLVSGINVNGISITGANTTAALNISGDQAIAILSTATESAVAGIQLATPTTKTVTTGLLMDGAGTVTTGINIKPEAATTGISVGLTGKTYATAISVGVTGGTLTAGLGFNGTVTAALDLTGLTAANGQATSTSGTAATNWVGRIKVLDAAGLAAWINIYSTSNEI